MMSIASKFNWLLNLVKNELSPNDYEQFNLSFPNELSSVWEHTCSALKLSMPELAKKISLTFSIDLATLPTYQLDVEGFENNILKKYNVIAIAENDRSILFATANPFDHEATSILDFLTDKHIEFAIATPPDIAQWFFKHLNNDKAATIHYSTATNIDSSATVRLVRRVLEKAILDRASDIHIEPTYDGGMVRFRIDGLLQKILTLPLPVLKQVGQRIKAVSKMDVSKSLIAQDGDVHLDTEQGTLNLRVSSIPVKGGEKFVIRLLKNDIVKPINEQGFLEPEIEQLRKLMMQKNGILVMSGPTGSGKTTTLNSAIQEINSIDKCIITIEDPVEYEIEGIAQVNINPAQGLTFDVALSHVLRQDPDVILVGEIRDHDTAETAIRSALTGHFVLTTLHTNDAITVIPRLKDLGISSALLADSLKGLAAQRLVRKLCPNCSEKIRSAKSKLEHEFLRVHNKLPSMRARGCEECNNTGYKGRIPLLEILIIDEDFADAIRTNTTTKQLALLAKKQGMRTLTNVATENILNGNTSAEEVFRVIGKELLT